MEKKLYTDNYFAIKKNGKWYKITYHPREKTWEHDKIILDKTELEEFNQTKFVYEKRFFYVEHLIESFQNDFVDMNVHEVEIKPTVCRWVIDDGNDPYHVQISITSEKKIKHLLIGPKQNNLSFFNVDYIAKEYPELIQLKHWFFTKSKYRIRFLFK